MNSKFLIVTCSFDDGGENDLRVLELLEKYNLKGTFYIPQKYEKRVISDNEIKILSRTQEIGAHTLTHPNLTEISIKEAKKEIFGSKDYLEKLTGKEIKMFCYPKGIFNNQIKEIVKEAGFIGARATKKFCLSMPEDYFDFGVTIHIYPFPLRKKNTKEFYLGKYLFQPVEQNWQNIVKLKLPLKSFLSWQNLAHYTFDHFLNFGGIFHFYGHSWEIERYGMWQDFENFLKYISKKKSIQYLTNSQILDSHENNFS